MFAMVSAFRFHVLGGLIAGRCGTLFKAVVLPPRRWTAGARRNGMQGRAH